MSNPGNDNRLEQLSREAASGYTPPGNASWEKMEAALDKVMPVEEKKKRRAIFWWLFPLAIISAGLVFSLLPEPGTIPPTQSVSTGVPSPTTSTIKSEKATEYQQEKITDNHKTQETEILKSNNNGVRNIDPKSISLKNNKIVKTLPVRETASVNKQAIIITTDNPQETKTQLNKQLINSDAEAVQKTADHPTKHNTTNTTVVYSIQPTIDTGSNKTINSIIEKTDTIINLQPTITDSLQADKKISTTKKTTDSKFSFALVAGMDASTVKFRHTDKAGINAGFIAGYHFTETWSVHTGVLFTRKNYTVAGEDFTAPKGSWVANYKLSMVDGFCNMWEVPLLLRYQFSGENKRSFFVSAGISSYFMTRENYNYTYYWNGQPVTRNSNYPNGNTHILSILRLSGGWRKSIGPGTSLLIEPYAALPLGGVGYGSIRLSSFGLNFSLQLRQPYEKK